jgi:toxin ParE1/3/4
MTRYEVVFSSSADADLDSILFYIAADNPLRAIEFVEDLRQRVETFLSSTPKGGARIGRFRYLVIGRYVAVYSIDDEALRVNLLLITEGHRNWQRLLDDLR